MTTPYRQPVTPGTGEFGLIAWLEETRIALPLKAVDVAFDVCGDLAEVSLDQVFHQTANRPLDVTYSFPLPTGAAVYRCELIVNDRVIAARVEEQAKAREIARAMKAAGRRVGLVEVERDNLFTLSLGNVQPDDLIVVRFAWFQTIDHAQRTMSLAIPFTPGVRYIPGAPLLRSNRGKGTESDTDQVPDASRISPPRIDVLHPDAALISLTGKLDTRFVDFDSVTSATHPVIVRDEAESLLVTIPPAGNVPDRDFVLRWDERKVEALDLKSVSCLDDEFRYAVVRLDAPADAPVAVNQSRDYYFLVDRSGSMAGKKWTCTAQALNAFVDELGESDRVWVTLFESSFQDYAEAPLPVADLKNDPVFRKLEKLGTAGGTELQPALAHVLTKIAAHSKKHDPVVVIITDGQVGNEASVLKLLGDHRALPVHTFGIDTAVNDAFLKQLAAQHRGACVLMTPNDDIPGAVRQLGNRLRRPVLTNLTVSAGWETTCAALPDVHAGEHVLVAVRGAKSAGLVELTGMQADATQRTFRFDLKDETIASPRLLWARQMIDRCLAEERQADAIQLAIRYNVVCRGAAFIAYDLKEKVSIAKEEIYQPSMEIAGGGPVCAAAPMAAYAPAPPPDSVKRRMPAPGAPSKTTSIAGMLGSAKDMLLNMARPMPASVARPDSEWSPQLREIRNRHIRDGAKPDLRVEILETAWREKTLKLAIFQTEAGRLLVELLSHWAAKDAVKRFVLLDQLAVACAAETSVRLGLHNFIKANVADSGLAKDLKWLAGQMR